MSRHDQLLRQAVACLCANYKVRLGGIEFPIRHIGELQGALVLDAQYTWWTVADNGGEFNVERINDHESMRSVACTRFGFDLDAATMAYRTHCVLEGEPIDYMRD